MQNIEVIAASYFLDVTKIIDPLALYTFKLLLSWKSFTIEIHLRSCLNHPEEKTVHFIVNLGKIKKIFISNALLSIFIYFKTGLLSQHLHYFLLKQDYDFMKQ